jgi:hypothetical protein
VLQVATLGLIVYSVWHGAPRAAVALMAGGLLVHLVLILRLARASMGGVGAHAEWVRDVATRRRLRESPAWLAGLLLVIAGCALALWG